MRGTNQNIHDGLIIITDSATPGATQPLLSCKSGLLKQIFSPCLELLFLASMLEALVTVFKFQTPV